MSPLAFSSSVIIMDTVLQPTPDRSSLGWCIPNNRAEPYGRSTYRYAPADRILCCIRRFAGRTDRWRDGYRGASDRRVVGSGQMACEWAAAARTLGRAS